MTDMTRDDAVAQAVARGWCTPENSHKEMDVVLAEAIAREVVAALQAQGEPPAAKPDAVAFGKLAECPPDLLDPPMTEAERTAKINEFKAKLARAEQPDAVAGLVELLAKVPLPPNAITYDKGWDLLNELQALAVAAALGRGEG